MAAASNWVLFAYRLPRDPSTPRTALWRRLRRLGVVQVVDGLVALPSSAETQEQFEWLAQEVEEAGGEASVWLAKSTTAREADDLEARMRDTVAGEYREIQDRARRLASESGDSQARELLKLRRELQRIGRRDYFKVPERAAAHSAVKELEAAPRHRAAS